MADSKKSPKKDPEKRFYRIRAAEVSMVSGPANRQEFLVIKEARMKLDEQKKHVAQLYAGQPDVKIAAVEAPTEIAEVVKSIIPWMESLAEKAEGKAQADIRTAAAALEFLSTHQVVKAVEPPKTKATTLDPDQEKDVVKFTKTDLSGLQAAFQTVAKALSEVSKAELQLSLEGVAKDELPGFTGFTFESGTPPAGPGEETELVTTMKSLAQTVGALVDRVGTIESTRPATQQGDGGTENEKPTEKQASIWGGLI